MDRGPRLVPLFVLFFTGCMARHVVPPEPPIPRMDPVSFEGVRLSVSTFRVHGATEIDPPEEANALRQRFLDYLAANGRFTQIADRESGYDKKGPSAEREAALDLDVEVSLEHTRSRTVILDVLFFYPGTLWWPITPLWGVARVTAEARIRDPGSGAVWSAKTQGEAKYSIFWYSWYRTREIEDAYRAAAAEAFGRLADDLAGHRAEILAKVHLEAPELAAAAEQKEPARNAEGTPVGEAQGAHAVQLGSKALAVVAQRPAIRGDWIVAVMEIADTNAGDPKRAVEPQVIRNLSDQLRVFVAQRGVRVIDRGQQERAMREVLQEAKAESYKACFDTSCQIPIGKALAASHVLRGQLTRFGQACVLNGELIDLKSEVTVAASSARGDCSEEGFLTASEALTAALLTPGHDTAAR